MPSSLQGGLYIRQRYILMESRLLKKRHWGGVRTPIFFIGGGARGDVYFQKFSNDSRLFFDMGIAHEVPLGCRDIYTYRFLKHQGYQNVMMTGCPAWYDLDFVHNDPDTECFGKSIRKICVSEPANAKNIPLLRELILHLSKIFDGAQICLVNHRELKQGTLKIVEELKSLPTFSFTNISGSAEGFRQYDDCDLHIGFRVHAHIYNLSRHQYSILINEDIRGRGVNHTLGLENIDIDKPLSREKKLFGTFALKKYNHTEVNINSAVLQHIDDYMEYSEMENYGNYKEAFSRVKRYFGNMEKHFGLIKRCLDQTQ